MSREAFEASYAEAHDLPLETFSQYRMGDTYRLPGIASHWRTWCAALESVVVELPAPYPQCDAECDSRCEHYNRGIEKCRTAIEVVGVRVL